MLRRDDPRRSGATSPWGCFWGVFRDEKTIVQTLLGLVVFVVLVVAGIHGVPVDRLAQVMLARWAGCELLPRLTKRTDALIVADPD